MTTDQVKDVRVALMEKKPARFLINWINDTFKTNIKDMADLSTGAIYCQLMHSVFPDSIDISKVIFSSKNKKLYGSNYELLQNSFNSLDLKKSIPKRKLLQGSGHLDLANWCYKFYQVYKKDEVPTSTEENIDGFRLFQQFLDRKGLNVENYNRLPCMDKKLLLSDTVSDLRSLQNNWIGGVKFHLAAVEKLRTVKNADELHHFLYSEDGDNFGKSLVKLLEIDKANDNLIKLLDHTKYVLNIGDDS